MNIIKLDAIDSTNSFLKQYYKEQAIENFTTVVADVQTNGRGQMGTEWNSDKGKNLTFSIFVKDYILTPNAIFDINCLVTTALITVFKKYSIPDLYVKWPNDILSADKKIVGILIENSLKSNGEVLSVIGIGINVNQTNFDSIPKASSLAFILNESIDRDILLKECIEELKSRFETYKNNGATEFWEQFHNSLFRKDTPTLFEDTTTNTQFIGTIKQVTKNGLLEVELANKLLKYYGIKEVKMIY